METPNPALLEAIQKAQSLCLITHLNPDGDGLGSEAALLEALVGMGKKVTIANQDAPGERYAFLKLESHYAAPGPVDLALILDTSVKSRIGSATAALALAKQVGVIDHHVGSEALGDLQWLVPSSPSTGSLIAPLLKALQVKLSPSMAEAIYVALAHDTGCFRYSNTSAEAFLLASELKAAGADTAKVNIQLFESRPLASVRLWAKALSDLKIADAGQSALAVLSLETIRSCGAKPEDTDGIVEAARAIQGVEVAAFLREEEGSVKLSTRSKSRVDVNRLCAQFGGGGHHRASGATLKMSLKEAKSKLSAALSEALGKA